MHVTLKYETITEGFTHIDLVRPIDANASMVYSTGENEQFRTLFYNPALVHAVLIEPDEENSPAMLN